MGKTWGQHQNKNSVCDKEDYLIFFIKNALAFSLFHTGNEWYKRFSFAASEDKLSVMLSMTYCKQSLGGVKSKVFLIRGNEM